MSGPALPGSALAAAALAGAALPGASSPQAFRPAVVLPTHPRPADPNPADPNPANSNPVKSRPRSLRLQAPAEGAALAGPAPEPLAGLAVLAPHPAAAGAQAPQSSVSPSPAPLQLLPGGGPFPPPGPWSQAQRLWWLLWCGCPGIGWQRLARLQAAFGGLDLAWQADDQALAQRSGFRGRLLEQVGSYRQRWGAAPLRQPASVDRLAARGPHRRLLPGDPAWPGALTRLARPPLQLHWQGQGQLWAPLRQRRAVAVVGTRRPSRHGLAMARALGVALAEAGWPVVSGLAEGIDGAVHQGCLAAGGAPVAVLGTPLERVYPRHHHGLQAQVAEAGLLISEHPPGTPVHPGHFASRNRLQVALAQAVVVVECPDQSGALHSASLAWDQGLPLWAVPADAGKLSAAGSNRLLACGASVLLDPQDLVRQLGPGPLASRSRVASSVSAEGQPGPCAALGSAAPAAGPPGPGAPAGASGPPPLAAAHQALLAAVGPGASLEQVCDRLDLDAAAASRALLELELIGQLRAEPGLWWSPSR